MAKKNPLKKTPAPVAAPQPALTQEAVKPAAKKAPTRKRAAKAATPAALPVDQDVKPALGEISLDYPQAGETITSSHYTLRIAALDAVLVEVKIDDAEWLPAREAVGYWWFDWSGFQPGGHTLRARVPGGPEVKRLVKVERADLPPA